MWDGYTACQSEGDMVATSTRIDPRVTRTRKLLLDAFLSPMAEKSFDEITVQDIAARATVNRATFYAHFVDKYALVDELTREGFTQMLQQRMATRALSIEEHLLRGLILRYRFSDEAQEAWQNDGQMVQPFERDRRRHVTLPRARRTMLQRRPG